MRISLIQMPIVTAAPHNLDEARAANMACAERLMASAPGAHLYVLPEMWSTGFAANPDGVAEPFPHTPDPHPSVCGPSVRWMIDAARRTRAAVAGSVATCSDGRYYNTLVLAQPDGTVASAPKRHLFAFGGEGLRYAPGNRRVVAQVAGVRFLLLVCYDLRFPVWSRCKGGTPDSPDADYDAILYVANWPRNRIDAWDVLLRARAIENQAWVVGVNRVGSVPYVAKDGRQGAIVYNGHSVVVDPRGCVCAQAEPQAEPQVDIPRSDAPAADAPQTGSVITTEISAQTAADFRRKFPVLADADEFCIRP